MSREELKRLASVTGVPFHTLRKISSGETPNPRIGTVEPIAQAIGISCKNMATATHRLCGTKQS